MKKSRIIDLTQSINKQMPLFPGTIPPEITEVANHENDGFLEHRISYHSHTGTHIDSPAHILSKGKKLTEFSLDSFIGKGICIPVHEGQIIDYNFIVSNKHELAKTDFALFCSGKGKEWGSETYFRDYPLFSEEAAQVLGTFNLKGIAMDTCSPDPVDSLDLPAHKTLLKYNILIIENLACMDTLVGKEFLFHAIPLKTTLTDGAPARAFAIIS